MAVVLVGNAAEEEFAAVSFVEEVGALKWLDLVRNSKRSFMLEEIFLMAKDSQLLCAHFPQGLGKES